MVVENPDVLPYSYTNALVNVVLSFDSNAIKQFYEGLQEGELNKNIPGLFALDVNNYLLDFNVVIGQYDEEEGGFQYDITLAELPSASGDYFQARLFEHYQLTKKGSLDLRGHADAPTIAGDPDSLPTLYICWGYGRDAKTWSIVHKAFINSIDYKFPTTGDKILKVQLKDSLSFMFDALANNRSLFQVSEIYDTDVPIATNISNVISKFLCASVYKSFVVVDLGQDFNDYLAAEENRILDNQFIFGEAPSENITPANINEAANILKGSKEIVEKDLQTLNDKKTELEGQKESALNSGGNDTTSEDIAEINAELEQTNKYIVQKTDEKNAIDFQITSVTQGQNFAEKHTIELVRTDEDTPKDGGPSKPTLTIQVDQPTGQEPVDLDKFMKHRLKIHRYKMLFNRKPFAGWLTFQRTSNKGDSVGSQPQTTKSSPAPFVMSPGGDMTLNQNYAAEWDSPLQDRFNAMSWEESYSSPYRVYIPTGQGANTSSGWHISNLTEEGLGDSGEKGIGKADGLIVDESQSGDPSVSIVFTGGNMSSILKSAADAEIDLLGPAHNEYDRFIRNTYQVKQNITNTGSDGGTDYSSDLTADGNAAVRSGFYQLQTQTYYDTEIDIVDVPGGTRGEKTIVKKQRKVLVANQSAQDNFYAARAEAQVQAMKNSFKEKEDAVYVLKMRKPAGLSLREFFLGTNLVGGSPTTNGIRQRINGVLTDSAGTKNSDSKKDKLDLIQCNIDGEFITSKKILDSGLDSFVYFGVVDKFDRYANTKGEDARYLPGTPFRRVYSLACTSESIEKRENGVVDLTPLSKDLVFTYGRAAINPPSRSTTQYKIKQEPIIVDMDYQLYGWYFLSLFAKPSTHKTSVSFLEEAQVRPYTILARIVKSGGQSSFKDFFLKWLVPEGQAARDALEKRVNEFWTAIVSKDTAALDVANYNSEENAKVVKELEKDVSELAKNIIKLEGINEAERKAALDVVFNLSLGHVNQRQYSTYKGEEELAYTSEEVTFTPNYDIDNQISSDNDVTIDSLLARQAEQHSLISSNMHHLFITVPGIPEINTMSEFFGQNPRVVLAQVFNHRTGTTHWLSGEHRLIGIEHRINPRLGYTSRLHLISYSDMRK